MSSSCSQDSQTLTTTVTGTPAALRLDAVIQAQGTGGTQARQQLAAVTAAGFVAKLPAGTLIAGAWQTGPAIPAGFLACDGSAVRRATFAALFTAIGTTWGAGDGSTTFNLPNFVGRVPVGVDTGRLRLAGTIANTLGGTGGEEFHTVTLAETPTHDHGLGTYNAYYPNPSAPLYNLNVTPGTVDQGPVNAYPWSAQGGGQAHDNMPPYQIAMFAVAV